MLLNDIQEILVSTDQIQRRVKELGEAISRDYQDKEPILVSILKGAVFFLSDLARAISIHISLDFMAISSYGDSQKTSGVVRILKDLDETITGREVLIVEDIIDTGLTLRYLLNNLEARKPASLKICTLLDKPFRRIVKLPIAYQGFEIPDKFVVGYGLDYKQRYRNLPFIGVLKPELLEDR
jgi:hypoxanthine phosphoribosyltransferase